MFKNLDLVLDLYNYGDPKLKINFWNVFRYDKWIYSTLKAAKFALSVLAQFYVSDIKYWVTIFIQYLWFNEWLILVIIILSINVRRMSEHNVFYIFIKPMWTRYFHGQKEDILVHCLLRLNKTHVRYARLVGQKNIFI